MNRRILYTLAVMIPLALITSCGGESPGSAKEDPPSTMQISDGFDWQGHRGARGIAPENSVPGFLKALEYPVTTLELDLAVSSDDQLIVSHEPWMSAEICSLPDGKPVPEGNHEDHAIMKMTAAEVREFDCGSRGHSGFLDQKKISAYKPTLREVVESVRSYCERADRPLPRFNIEIKSNPDWDGILAPVPSTFVKMVYEEMKSLGIMDQSCVQSFDFRVLKALHTLDPGLSMAVLISNGKGIKANMEELGFTPEVYSPYFRLVSAGMVDSAHTMGLRVIPWTVNEVDQMETLRKMGVDGIITDYPNKIQEIRN